MYSHMSLNNTNGMDDSGGTDNEGSVVFSGFLFFFGTGSLDKEDVDDEDDDQARSLDGRPDGRAAR